MCKIVDVFCLKVVGLVIWKIVVSFNVGQLMVSEYLKCVDWVGLLWLLFDGMDEVVLEW